MLDGPDVFTKGNLVKPQLTFVGTVYYQSGELEGDATSIEIRTCDNLITDEQPFTRLFWVDEAWTIIETGWLQQASFMVIDNRGIVVGNTNPTEEERKSQEVAILQVGIMPPNVIEARDMHSPPRKEQQPIIISHLLPQRKFPIPSPQNIKQYRLRCMKGKTKVQVNVFPL